MYNVCTLLEYVEQIHYIFITASSYIHYALCGNLMFVYPHPEPRSTWIWKGICPFHLRPTGMESSRHSISAHSTIHRIFYRKSSSNLDSSPVQCRILYKLISKRNYMIQRQEFYRQKLQICRYVWSTEYRIKNAEARRGGYTSKTWHQITALEFQVECIH